MQKLIGNQLTVICYSYANDSKLGWCIICFSKLLQMHTLIYKDSRKYIWGRKTSSTVYTELWEWTVKLSEDTHKISSKT